MILVISLSLRYGRKCRYVNFNVPVLWNVCEGPAFLRLQETKAFWLPSKAPEARDTIAKPDMLTYCPASKKKLKLKDLIPVKFSRVPEGQTGYAMDPVTGDTFTNANKLVLLRATGTPPEPTGCTLYGEGSSTFAPPQTFVGCANRTT